jgi:hypothetical protein
MSNANRVSRLILVLAILQATLFAAPACRADLLSDHWPATVYGGSAFADIGKAIALEPDFPTHGTELDKARYAYSRLPEIQKKYNLEAGTGTKVSDATVWLGRKGDFRDPEDVNALKSLSKGNCAEWSEAFQMVLHGVGVNSTVIYADKSAEPGYSGGFTGTDTSLMVEEVLPDGRKVRRVFDAFRAVYHAQEDGTPIEEMLKEFGDVPMEELDRLPRDKDRKLTWRENLQKPFVKAQQTEALLPPTTTIRIPKTTVATVIPHLVGKWRSEAGSIFFIYEENNMLTARIVKPSARSHAMGIPDGAYLFRNGILSIAPPVTIKSKNAYNFAAKSDCESLAPYTAALATAQLHQNMDILSVEVKAPQYYPKGCRWAPQQPWALEKLTLTKIPE